jgi:hypothetical protein
MLGKEKMTNAQIRIHEAAIVAIAQWLTALCTPGVQTLDAEKLEVEICIRFICTHILAMTVYAQHLTSKFIAQAGKIALNAAQVTALGKSCRGEDDELLVGLTGKLVEKKINGEIAGRRLDMFLSTPGNHMLKARVEELKKEMGLTLSSSSSITAGAQGKQDSKTAFMAPTAKMEKLTLPIKDKKENARGWEAMDDSIMEVVQLDKDGWQVLPGAEVEEEQEGTPRKKVKLEE